MGEYEEQRRRRIEENKKRLHELLPPDAVAAAAAAAAASAAQIHGKPSTLSDEYAGEGRRRRRKQRLVLPSDVEGELVRRRSARLAGHAGPSFEKSQDMLLEAVGFEEEERLYHEYRKPRARLSMHDNGGTKNPTRNMWVGQFSFFFVLNNKSQQKNHYPGSL